MNVFILAYEHGEYSDYTCGVIGIYTSKEKAESAIQSIKDYKAEVASYNESRTQALVEAGLARNVHTSTTFWKRRTTFWNEWTEQNPKPTCAVHVVYPDTSLEYFPWDAEFDIVETELT